MQPPKVMRWVVVLALAEGVFLKPDKVVDIDEQIQVLENQKSEATVEDLQKATQTIQTQAAAAAEEALAAQKHVEEMEMQQKALLAKANDYIAQQKESVKYAKDSNKELEKELEKAKQFAKTADASVKDLAKTAVQQMFIAKNKELSSWRDEVLTDHWALGRREAIEAAEPYKHAWGEALEKANSYKSTARTLSSVAKGLADEVFRQLQPNLGWLAMQMALCASHRQQVLCAAMVGNWKAMLRTCSKSPNTSSRQRPVI